MLPVSQSVSPNYLINRGTTIAHAARPRCDLKYEGTGLGANSPLVTFPQMPSVALRDRASSSATPRASPVAARPHPSPIRRKTLPVLSARQSVLVRDPSAFHRLPAAFKWIWLLALSPAEFPRTRRARGFSGRGPRESIDRVWQCKLREAVPARTRARCPD